MNYLDSFLMPVCGLENIVCADVNTINTVSQRFDIGPFFRVTDLLLAECYLLFKSSRCVYDGRGRGAIRAGQVFFKDYPFIKYCHNLFYFNITMIHVNGSFVIRIICISLYHVCYCCADFYSGGACGRCEAFNDLYRSYLWINYLPLNGSPCQYASGNSCAGTDQGPNEAEPVGFVSIQSQKCPFGFNEIAHYRCAQKPADEDRQNNPGTNRRSFLAHVIALPSATLAAPARGLQ